MLSNPVRHDSKVITTMTHDSAGKNAILEFIYGDIVLTLLLLTKSYSTVCTYTAQLFNSINVRTRRLLVMSQNISLSLVWFCIKKHFIFLPPTHLTNNITESRKLLSRGVMQNKTSAYVQRIRRQTPLITRFHLSDCLNLVYCNFF